VQNCIFCRIVLREIPSKIIRESEQVVVLQDIAPKAPIHFLIIPKKHIRDLSSCDSQDGSVLSEILMMAQTLSKEVPGAENFKLLVNNGHSAGQRVFHLHFHFLAGKVFSE
jgi:histidine triad (HIT) family protein